jgi:hypothetical protein
MADAKPDNYDGRQSDDAILGWRGGASMNSQNALAFCAPGSSQHSSFYAGAPGRTRPCDKAEK